MNAFSASVLGAPAATGILSWLATFLLHSTILLGLAWVLSRRLSGRHPLAEQAIWRAALFGSILTATLQIATGWQPIGGALSLATESNGAEVGAEVSAAAALETPRLTTIRSRAAAGFEEASPVVVTSDRSPSVVTAGPNASLRLTLWGGIALAWGFVVAALLGRLGLAHAALSRRLRPRLEVIDGTLYRTLRRLRAEAGLASPVRLTCAHRLSVPIALGLSRPEICVPPRALSHLDEREGESLLAHELAHLAQRDPAALTLTQIAASFFFFQPLVWLARRRLRDLSEVLADDWAIGRTGRPLSLARCLAEVACWSVHERRLPVPSMAEASSPLGHRIRRLLGEIRPARRLPAWALPACGIVLITFAAVAPAVSAGGKESPKTPSAKAAPSAKAPKARAPRNGEEYRSPQPSETYVHETPRRGEGSSVFTEAEERELEEHAERMAAELAQVGKGWDEEEFGRQMAEVAKGFEMSPQDRARLEGEIDALVARTMPDPAELKRLTSAAARLADLNLSPEERERLAAEVRRSAEKMRPSKEQLAELQRRARELAPSAEVAQRMAEDARRYADAHRPSEEELQTLREHSREYEREVRRMVEKHRAEIEKMQREMEEKLEDMQERLQEDVERSLGGEEQGLRDQAHRGGRAPRAPRAPRAARPVVAPAPVAPAAPGLPPRAALAPLAPMAPAAPAPRALPAPSVAPTPDVAPAPRAPRVAPVPAVAPVPGPAPAPRALPAPAPEAPEVSEVPEAPEAPEAPPARG